jgi:hypothetical protein
VRAAVPGIEFSPEQGSGRPGVRRGHVAVRHLRQPEWKSGDCTARRHLTPHQRKEAIALREAGESETTIARSFNVNQSTISRFLSAAS